MPDEEETRRLLTALIMYFLVGQLQRYEWYLFDVEQRWCAEACWSLEPN